MLRSNLFVLFLAGSGIVVAQDPAILKFEIASVKPAGPEHDGPTVYRVGPGTDSPERITFERQSLLRLISVAYGLDWDQISGPAWLGNAYYAVDAKVPPGTTQEQVKLMWQDLLAERFNLKVHFSTKEFPAFELSVAKNGPKLRKSGDGPAQHEPGFPVLAPGARYGLSMAPPRNVRQTFQGYSMKEFCQKLAWTVAAEGQSSWMGYFSVGRVVDKTGLDGSYDFTFEFAGRFQSGAYPPPLPDGELDTASTLFDALQQQLGLRLQEKKAKLDVLIVDRADRVPTEN